MDSRSWIRASRLSTLGWCGLLCLLSPPPATADSFHEQIDAAIAAGHEGPWAPAADDSEFLRRVHLDLAGTVPTVDAARKFLADTTPIKRDQLVARLLADARFARRMQEYFSVMLLERRPGNVVADDLWEAYLRESFAADKPLDQLVRELVSADGTEAATRPAMNFLLTRSATDHRRSALDVGRLLLGRSLECAQCHDHPAIDDYHQSDFYGLVAFLNRSYLYRDKKTQQQFLTEKPNGAALEFSSVFTGEAGKTGPRLLDRQPLEVPQLAEEEALAQPAAEGKPPIPKIRLRQQLGQELTSANNRHFARNLANRLWAYMMGRGLVEPLGMHHAGNPPSHPALLDLLADELIRSKFDIKAFLGALARSKTYQRSSRLGDDAAADNVPPESFAVFNMKSLSPEQLAWTVMQTSGQLKRVLATPADKAATKKYRPDKGYPMPAENLDNVMKLFRSVYAAQVGEPEDGFRPSLAAALFVANEDRLLDWFTPRDGNLADRLVKLSDADAVADELYLALLTRLPTDDERRAVAEYMGQKDVERSIAVREMAWALLASSEFRLNH